MLTIADFQTNYHLPKGTPDHVTTQRRMDRLARERLPEEMADKLIPPSTDENAVYRIRNLRVDLWLDALGMSEGEIVQRWSTALVTATTHALVRGTPTQVVRFDDPAHFVTAFLGDLMTGQAWRRWVYDEFAPLRGLPVGRIAAHLLAPRPALLIEVMQRLAHENRLEALLQQFDIADARMIWEQGLGFETLPDAPVRSRVLEQILEALAGGAALEQGAQALARNMLRLYLYAIIAQPSLAKNAATGTVCHHMALVHQMWTARPAPWLWRALGREEIASPAPLAPLLDSLPSALSAARDWFTAILGEPSGRAYLARLIAAIVPEAAMISEPIQGTETTPGTTERPSERTRQATTNFAGLALLLPVIRDMGLHMHLSREGLYQLLLTSVGVDAQPLAWSDAGPMWLVGLTAQEAMPARNASIVWPKAALWDIPDLGEVDVQHLGELPRAAFALLVLRRFAQALRGFAESSPAYLMKQFINLPGSLKVNSERVEVHFNRAPLGIVLQMASQDGDRGPMPWLDDRHLWIHLDG